MVNTNNILIERNKELLAKIEELEKKEKTEISREAQLKIIERIEKWKKENYEIGDRLRKYEGNTYPSHIVDNVTEDRPLWKSLAGHVNFELMMVQYLNKKENPLDELLEMMLNSITRNVIRHYNSEGLKEKERKEQKEKEDKLKGKITRLIKETFPYDKLKEKPLKWNERLGVERGYLDTINGTDYSDYIISFYKEREEEFKNKEDFIKELENENDFLEESAKCNLDAIKKCEEWERREKGKLREEIDNKQTLLKECFDEYVKKDRELRTANKWLEESQQNLRENRKEGLQKDEKIKRLEEQLSLANKPLPKIPSKIKLFRKEIKTKLHQFTQKFKLQKQTMIAQIEVLVKK